ncbi:MAG: argininosuccinate lyase [Acidobacteriia bacterium]|nr:argininosuccinate lyase [Terriglobia bacterium]
MWSGRFREPLDPEFEQWQRSFAFDVRLLPDELAASRAYARALAKAGVFTTTELESVVHALGAIAAKGIPNPADHPGVEDVHQFVEQELVSLIGDTGYKLHAGRSRNEQISTDLRLYTRRSIDAIVAAIAALASAFVAKAEQYKDDVMPSYTHMQRAEPVLVAHWLLAWVEMWLRDAARLTDCRRRVNVLPLGSGAVAGPGMELDRAAIAKELGFETISGNSMDATSDRDFELEYLHALGLLALHVSRWAEEMALFSTVEYGFVQLPEPYSTGSSAMPQKKNPDALELLRGKTGRILGAATALQTVLKGLPLAYNKDLQEAQEPLFAATDSVLAALAIATGFVATVALDTERMKQAASAGFLNATAAARYLVKKGVAFRLAHSAVGQAVRLALEKKCELDGLSLQELKQFRPEFDRDFFNSLKLEAVLASHDVAGGTAPGRVRKALGEARRRIGKITNAAAMPRTRRSRRMSS